MARFPYPDLGGGGGLAGGFMQGMSAMSSIQAQNLQNQKLRYEMQKDKEDRKKADMANQLSGFVYALNKDPAVAYGMIPDALGWKYQSIRASQGSPRRKVGNRSETTTASSSSRCPMRPTEAGSTSLRSKSR